MRFWFGLIGLACALAPDAGSASQAPKLRMSPVVGKEQTYTVERSESLYRIARRHNVSTQQLARLNGITGSIARKGVTLKLPRVHVLPMSPAEGIVLNIPERAVYVFRKGALRARHAVAVGKPSWPTALGTYALRSKAVNPTWTPPRSMVRREGTNPEPVPPGPENPLGDRWMGWSRSGYGFHSTTSPRSIGSAASHGCVRLYPEAARTMFGQVTVGMPIYSVYRPVLLGKRDGAYFLSVFDDPYGMGGAALEDVQKAVEAAGLLPFVRPSVLREAVARRDGYPRRLAGEPEALEVDGLPVITSVPLARTADGRWMVPARAAVEALGGGIAPNGGGDVAILTGTRTLIVRPGDTTATLDAEATELPASPTVVEGVLMVPARTVADLFGARVDHIKGEVLRLVRDPLPVTPGP